MGSLALPPLLPEDMADAMTRPPELSDPEYVREVLKQPTDKTEEDIENDLAAKAQRLGINTSTSTSRPSTPDKPNTPGGESPVTIPARHVRTNSSTSNGSASSTGPTSPYSSAIPGVLAEPHSPSRRTRKRTKGLSFSQYEKYISQVDPNLSQPRFLPPSPVRAETAASIFSVSTRRGVRGIKRGIDRLKSRRRSIHHSESMVSCICCRDDFDHIQNELQTLPCGHTYCRACLTVMINQSTTDESNMPPRCCTQPIPGSIIKSVLNRDEQHVFLKAVLQYSTPWEARIFCPNPSCAEFIPPRNKLDPKHPFEVVCKNCKAKVCIMCKRNAHRLGQDCPDDWELDAVLKIGEKSGWRRCYKCRTLVELTQGCTHMTCRCKAQFCYICGAVWDPVVGCPNFCNGEEELERRRMEEEARIAELEAEKQAQEERAAVEEAERLEAEKRTKESEDFKKLGEEQAEQMKEFRSFEHKMKWIMWTRHSHKRLAMIEKYKDQIEKMKERHAKTEQSLEDRQIEAEIELRANLDQSEKSIRIQLKHMEAYCNGLGHHNESDMPEREVTQKHLEQLGQQYHLRDGMERKHQSQINVLREKQAKRMEELMERHEKEMKSLLQKRAEEIENLGLRFANEEEVLVREFGDRKTRLQRRWQLASEILRKELESRDGLRYGLMPPPEWPGDGSDGQDESLPSVREEEPRAG